MKEDASGKMYDARFGTRGTGEGPYADSIAALFEQTTRKLGLETGRAGGTGHTGNQADDGAQTTFERPAVRAERGSAAKTQLSLF